MAGGGESSEYDLDKVNVFKLNSRMFFVCLFCLIPVLITLFAMHESSAYFPLAVCTVHT